MGTPAPGNIPGGRAGAAKWTDSQGHLWLFSGSGFDAKGYFGDTNDLWEFNPATSQWAWMGGNNSIPPCSDYYCTPPAVLGELGTPAVGNLPWGRDHAVSWTDDKGNFWLFGGGGGEVPNFFSLVQSNDLWEFNRIHQGVGADGRRCSTLCGVYCVMRKPKEGFTVSLDIPAPGDGAPESQICVL